MDLLFLAESLLLLCFPMREHLTRFVFEQAEMPFSWDWLNLQMPATAQTIIKGKVGLPALSKYDWLLTG